MHKNVYTHGYSMVKIAHLDDAFSYFFKLEASPVEGQSLQKEGKEKRKGKAKKNLETFISVHARARKCRKNVERKACCHFANAF